MRILGLCASGRNGSAEILLKAALRGAEQLGATVEMVRTGDLDVCAGPSAVSDDNAWFWNRLMESDALVVSSPVYTRTIPGTLRLLGDKVLGPHADIAFTSEVMKMRAAGEAVPFDFSVDERLLRPRVGGFIAVGGSIDNSWKTLALPLMHTLTASMQIAIVDQVQFAGAGSPSSIVLQPHALERAAQLGRTVASQLGRAYDEAEYRGEDGICPQCHLNVIVIGADGVECATCGARGSFTVTDGRVGVFFDKAGQDRSIISLAEKEDHFREVVSTAKAHAPLRAQIDDAAAQWADWDPSVTPPR